MNEESAHVRAEAAAVRTAKIVAFVYAAVFMAALWCFSAWLSPYVNTPTFVVFVLSWLMIRSFKR